MKSIIRVLAVTVAAAAMVLAGTGTSAQARANPPGWCIVGHPGVDGTCTF